MSSTTLAGAPSQFAALPGHEQRVLAVGIAAGLAAVISASINATSVHPAGPYAVIIIGAGYLLAHTTVHVPTRRNKFSVTANEAGMWLILLTLPTWLALPAIVAINTHRAVLPDANWAVKFTNATVGLIPITATLWVLPHLWPVSSTDPWPGLMLLMGWAVVYCILDMAAECVRYPYGTVKELLSFMPVKTMATVVVCQSVACWVGLLWAWHDPYMRSSLVYALVALLIAFSVVAAYRDRRRLNDLSSATQLVAQWSTTSDNTERLLRSLTSLTPRGVLVLVTSCPVDGELYAKHVDSSLMIRDIPTGGHNLTSLLGRLPAASNAKGDLSSFVFSTGDEFWNLNGLRGTYRVRYFSGGCLIQLERRVTMPIQLRLGVIGNSRRELERIVPVELTIRSLSEAWEQESRQAQSNRERSELVNLLSVSSDGIATISDTGAITSWNDTMCRWTGLRSSEALGCDYREVLPTSTTEPVEGLERFRWEIRENGGTRYLECALTRLPGAVTGSIYASMISCRDVSQHVLTDRKRNEHIAVVSHELTSPTTSIIMHASLAQDMLDEQDPVREQVDSIVDSASQLEVIASDLSVTATVVTSGAQSVRIEPGNVEARDIVHPSVTSCGAADGQVVVRGCLGASLWCDSMRARQILQNLLTNAVKYSPSRAPITVSIRTDRSHVHIDVIDNGVGVPTDEQSILFARFFRGQRNTGQPGAGIGLATSQELSKVMGGRVTYSDRVGQPGSIFTLSLPSCPPLGDGAPAVEVREVAIAGSHP